MTTPTLPITIRVTVYWAGYDELNEIYIIGPYATATARDADIGRLASLPGVHGLATFEASRIPPEAAHWRASPERLATAANLEQISEAFHL